MDEDFEIELLDEIDIEPELPQLPVNFLSFGEIENDDVKVYIHQEVYKKLESYSATDTHTELGSILLGNAYEDQGKNFVVISDYIEAKYTDASAATLTFTHETWDYVHKERNRRDGDNQIVGWQHTHPNYGIFLSNYDLFIQENFFDLPFQVAYVIDPVQNKRGFFQWKNGKVEKLRGFYVYNDVDKPVKIELTNRKAKDKEKKKIRRLYTALTLLSVAVVALGVLAFCGFRMYRSQQKEVKKVTTQLTQQEELIAQQEQALNELTQMIQYAANEDGTVSAVRLLVVMKDSESAPEGLVEALEEMVADQVDATFFCYTVAKGDDLYTICKDHGIDYSSYRNLILGLNGLGDGSYIEVGQVLLLPVCK